MNPIVGVPPNQVNINDPNVSDYAKFEAAKSELAFCLSMAKINKEDQAGTLEKEKRASELYEYLQKQQKQNKACYIATMAYDNYDPLSKSRLGTWLISKYYLYSPKLVRILQNKKSVNYLIRKLLNQFIKLIG